MVFSLSSEPNSKLTVPALKATYLLRAQSGCLEKLHPFKLNCQNTSPALTAAPPTGTQLGREDDQHQFFSGTGSQRICSKSQHKLPFHLTNPSQKTK